MRKKIRLLLTGLLMLAFLISITMLIRQQRDNFSGGSAYDDAMQIAFSDHTGTGAAEETQPSEPPKAKSWVPAPIEDEDPVLQTLEEISLDALRKTNPDVLGWILIPDTKINYPILQGEDNAFYLKHTWEGKKNSVGSIFMECENTPDFADFNTIIYGHNMNNGSMFAGIKRYRALSYWEKHPYVYIRTDDGVFRYEVFSSYQAELTGSAYGLSFHQSETRVSFLTEALKNSNIDTGIKPEITDRILTLSTCSGAGYSTRWVVHARLKMVQEETDAP